MITSREMALSPFETALLQENTFESGKPVVGRSLVIILVILFALLYAPPAQTAEVPLEAGSLLSVLNGDRLQYGLTPLAANQKLVVAATAKAKDILERGYFAHTSPSGTKPWDFIKAANFQFAFAGENLAINYSSAFDLQKDFMNSPAHRENLLSPLFSEVGIAVVSGSYQGKPALVTVEMFGSPLSP